MAPRTPPSSLQAGSHLAENDRLWVMSTFGSPAGSFAGGIPTRPSPLDPGHGVDHSDSMKVTANGTPNMSVNVAAGGCFIRGTLSPTQGVYHGYNDASGYNIAIAASDPTNGRRDLIVARVRDSAYSGATDNFTIEVVTGTPSGVPADPTIPANCVVLARVQVDAAATTITSGKITDLRTLVRPWGVGWGEIALVDITADTGGIGGTITDINQATATFYNPGARRYGFHIHIPRVRQNVADGEAKIFMTDGANTAKGKGRWQHYFAGGGTGWVSTCDVTVREDLTVVGSTTRKFRGQDTANSFDVLGATNAGYLSVIDLGPV